ncbi:C1-5,6,7,8-tetrahydrofolate (THF) synthase, trifunctional enzyme Thf1 [Schizosaccharomyces pombe]|uniref:C-1-tetrahydrofolate synthase, cytoplasmic n=1 Tax=Schizosaccharomyces pombe (strain 972 / ATCC 24843) TaxID=284812 RepID=C1TC_SCHPO|nr:C1-5,6,7,8-tetrahydrofolate (THF) synthase [Schizosaccharomyces pombe]Q8WZJ7.1 RecName: Full=C-1-tetrahydrofolate synthase, cytoplasmic; Short=C1-THF synthase; Includes: RecName: Full=Methylenetetrahydrofolate dehydrogenase; Includes: RecName: Full=Methenyltetrahydrofolate cyclohydrolase; Includes: RecName: Full=Formyltetrahydrofolate synthetase [Schizosaccharomyces pombe 972h-]CAB46709.1 C1-5,6,7,8-tetrahydrofolate (THF) synthase [Schizosaccharomyces pombe]|eukprot:NP_595256.1 C1-5,6,7,8-tetrahydrofolate (THF) synthase [Schizosaccharomyces pombe]
MALLLEGTSLARKVREELREQISSIKSVDPYFNVSLKIIQVGGREDSNVYVRMKTRAANEAGISCEHVNFPEDITEYDLLLAIKGFNEDPTVHGIIVQLPLPAHINEQIITEAVAPEKDVDGFCETNLGKLTKREGQPLFTACTPKGIMCILKHYGINVQGKHAVVIGRSNIVGRPMSILLEKANATVTLCHSKTESIADIVRTADIVVAAIGIPHFVKADWLKKGVVAIDVGINSIPDATKKSGYRLTGDIDFENAKEVASAITPVPGSVGPMTVAMLLQNVVESAVRFRKMSRKRKPTLLPLKLQTPVPSDIEIARSQTPKNIGDLASEIGIAKSELEFYGSHKAKVNLEILQRLAHRRDGHYVVVTGITPTPFGEGKSTLTAGLVQALSNLDKLAIACVRQPSQGPTFGIKGGAAGGGYSQFIPMEEFNLHLTGDIHAITAATNLLAAAIDTRMFHENTQSDAALYKRLTLVKGNKREFAPVMFRRLKKLGIDKTNPEELTEEEQRKFARLDIEPSTISWNRTLDVNDRFLRKITIGENPTEKGFTRQTGFDLSVASECMSVLALATDLKDMRERLGRMVVASNKSGEPVTADDLGVGGALTVLLKDAIKPTLMQTLEGTPALVHAGPFANISIGASSILADRIALKLAGTEVDEDAKKEAGYVVTEAGFASDIGMEKFFNIKCRTSGLKPDAIVIVATVQALKLHGGGPPVGPGKPIPEVYKREDVDLVRKGCANLAKHISNARKYGLPVVVAINKFSSDSPNEISAIREEALAAGATDAVDSNHWAEGGKGALGVARALINACENVDSEFRLLYDVHEPIEKKIEIIAKEMYGADGIELSPLAKERLETFTKQGYNNLPICIAKTQYSLSHDPDLKGAPTNFTVPIRDMRLSAGAGFIYPLAAAISTIPGLPTKPAYYNIDIAENGDIVGLS